MEAEVPVWEGWYETVSVASTSFKKHFTLHLPCNLSIPPPFLPSYLPFQSNPGSCDVKPLISPAKPGFYSVHWFKQIWGRTASSPGWAEDFAECCWSRWQSRNAEKGVPSGNNSPMEKAQPWPSSAPQSSSSHGWGVQVALGGRCVCGAGWGCTTRNVGVEYLRKYSYTLSIKSSMLWRILDCQEGFYFAQKKEKKFFTSYVSYSKKPLWAAITSAGAAGAVKCGLGLAMIKHQGEENWFAKSAGFRWFVYVNCYHLVLYMGHCSLSEPLHGNLTNQELFRKSLRFPMWSDNISTTPSDFHRQQPHGHAVWEQGLTV